MERERITLTKEEFVDLYNETFNDKESYEWCGCDYKSKKIRLQSRLGKVIKIDK